jgi:hypothetical protein
MERNKYYTVYRVEISNMTQITISVPTMETITYNGKV